MRRSGTWRVPLFAASFALSAIRAQGETVLDHPFVYDEAQSTASSSFVITFDQADVYADLRLAYITGDTVRITGLPLEVGLEVDLYLRRKEVIPIGAEVAAFLPETGPETFEPQVATFNGFVVGEYGSIVYLGVTSTRAFAQIVIGNTEYTLTVDLNPVIAAGRMVVVESQLATPSQSLAPVSIADCESVPRVWVADIGLEVHPAVFGQYADPECSQAPVDCEAIQKAATAEDVLLAFGLISQRFRRHYGIELRIPGCNAGQEQCFLNIYTSITDEDASPPWNAGTSLGLEGLRVAFRQSTDYAPRALTHFLLSSTTNGASNPDAVCGEAVAFSQSHFLGTSPPTGFRVARHEIEHLFGGVHSSGLPAFCGEVDGSSEISSDLLCQQHIVRVITEAAPCLQELVFALGDWNRDSLLDSFDLAAAEACVRAPSLPCTDTFDFDGDRRVTPCDVDTLQRHEDYAGAVPAEPDCNTNAINDCTEIAQSPFADCDGNGVPDTCDLAAGGSDCNSNAVLDACESGDCSWDGADFDICGVEAGATDCDNNNIPDICDVNAGHDCNHNQVPDECDIFLQTSSDCNENLIPDECIARERDCNLNGVPDECDTEALTSVDCNANQVPDECEPGYDMDCNANDVMDVCEVASGVAADINDDGVPDECDVSQILYVTSTSQCPGSGTPQEPFCDIKRALEAADEDGVAYEIVLADGVYTGSGNRFLSFRSDRVIVRSQNGPEACIVDYRTSEVTLQQTGFVFSGDGPGIQVSGITFTNSFTPSDFASAAPMVVSDDSSPRIEGCVFRDLRVVRKGGVISVGPGTHPVIENCRFENIQSDYFGAIGLLGGGNAEIVNCEFINVHTDLHGAAIFVEDASGRIVNSLFVGNTAGGWGGAVFSTYGNVSLINCTLANNEAAGRGGAVMGSLESVVSIRNTIIWDNVASQGPGLWVDGSSQLGANFSNVQGGLLSAGCPASAEWNAINSEPVFIDPEAGDYRVACSSPCRDSADATARPPDSGDLDSDGDTSEPIPVDLAGVGRVLGGGIDMGALEYTSAVLRESPVVVKNRYLSFSPEDLPESSAISVELTSLHHPDAPSDAPDLTAFEGQVRYVNSIAGAVSRCCNPNSNPLACSPLVSACDSDGDCYGLGLNTRCIQHLCPDSPAYYTFFPCAKLGCEPEYRDWAREIGNLVLHVAGAAIAPSSTYGVRQLTVACGEGYSTPTVVVTGRWGDIDNSGGAPSALDMGFVVSKVKDAVGAFIKPRTQLREAVPNSLALVGAPDIARLQDAVKGRPYPATFAIPSCEANVLCNETPCTDAIDDCGLDGTCVDGYCRDSAGRCAQQP